MIYPDLDNTRSFGQAITDQGLHSVVIRTEASQLHFLGILNLFGIAVAPFDGHIRVCVSVHEDVECAVSVQNWEEGDRGRNLAKDSLYLFLDLFLGLLNRSRTLIFRVSVAVYKVVLVSLVLNTEERQTYPGVAFSLSADFREVWLLACFPNIWTW